MGYKIREINNKETWENFLLDCGEKTFLQSWNWGEFQKMMGNKIWRLGIFLPAEALAKEGENGNLISVAFLYKIQAKRGTFLFLPHGPSIALTKEGDSAFKYEILKTLLEELKKLAREENTSFIRLAPILEKNEENNEIFKKLCFREAPIHIHPELTWQLDITPPEENLLKNTRETTRYLIRRAPKEGVEIIKSQEIKDIEIFNKLYREVARRQNFAPFSLNYLKNEFLSFQSGDQISIFFGKYKGEIISSGIFIFWQGIGFYHHGASSLKYPKIPASYSLLWEAILEAKKRGCKLFNFWGIAPINGNWKLEIGNLKRHPWAGLTLFKMGFGGYKKEYLKTQDFLLSKKYWINYIIEKLRKKKRGL